MQHQFKIMHAALAALALAGQASAATTWTLNTGTVTDPGTSVGASSTGWANTMAPDNLEIQPAGTNLRLYSGGLGINNLDGCASTGTCGDPGDEASAAPEHAIDNQQRNEMVLLSFSKAVNLTNVNFKWTGKSNYSADSDYTVMAFQGTTGQQGLAGKTWATLNSGWKLIGHYSDALANENRALGPSSTNVYSSFWLIGAYNPLVGSSQGWTTGNDYLKLASVTGSVCTTNCSPPSVSEPGSLVLLGIGLLGLFRKRKFGQA